MVTSIGAFRTFPGPRPARAGAPSAAQGPPDRVQLFGPGHPHPEPPKNPGLEAALRVNGSPEGRIRPGAPAVLEVSFTDPSTGELVTDFEPEHEKLMHMIVVSEDLETFAHLHPELDCRGRFRIDVNQPSQDPDNQDAAGALPKAGRYLVFTEVKPAGEAVIGSRFLVQSEGAHHTARLDDGSPEGAVIRRYFTAEGEGGRYGDRYQATLTTERPAPGRLHFSLNLQAAHQGQHGLHYLDVTDAENWLGMPGHAVLIGAAGSPEDRVFRHLHAGHGDHVAAPVTLTEPGHPPGGGNGPDFTFMLHDQDVPPPGVYKLWVQLKHEGRILTLPFALEVPSA